MSELSLSQLLAEGYTEDRASKHRFERRYGWFTIPGVVLCLGPYPLIHFGWIPMRGYDEQSQFFIVAGCFLLGFALAVGAGLHITDATPISVVSGLPMQKYSRSDAPEDTVHYLYVDHQSRTYFSRLVSTSGSE